MINAGEQKHAKRRTAKLIMAVAAAVIVIAVAVCAVRTPWMFKMEYETINEKDYSKCLRLVNSLPGVVEVFPKSIPADAKNAAFKAYTNLGGTLLELSLTAERSTIGSFIEKAEENASCFGTKIDRQVIAALPSYILRPLAEDDRIFVLDSEPYRNGSFNHAKLVWVVANENTHSITFHAEKY